MMIRPTVPSAGELVEWNLAASWRVGLEAVRDETPDVALQRRVRAPRGRMGTPKAGVPIRLNGVSVDRLSTRGCEAFVARELATPTAVAVVPPGVLI